MSTPDKSKRAEGIAIVGIGCRFPGGAYGPQRFWELLREGRDAITEMPRDRFDLDALFDADPHAPARMYTRWGGFIDDVDRFDARFFGISPREAVRIDVQHRLLLETVWEALEDAGLPADRLAGSRTGVFVGISTHDYGDIEMYPGNREQLDAHSNTGTATSIAANRISYLYDFRGPSFIVDTACSSALTAVHLACQSLRTGESSLAVAAGVQLLLAPELTMGFCRASMLSPDGRCRAFDHRANGYVRSEGVGVVILKPLGAALADGDPIYAVVRGSAINQDGRTNGMTVPSEHAQQAMLREALAAAGIAPADVDYVEAHGPGTAVGDPIEAGALGAVLSEGRPKDRPCLIGSVKTNIGHLEAGSGIAGLIKAALCVRHRQIPASLHFERPNPAIDLEGLNLRVVTALEAWPVRSGPATAGVNCFGFGGANAHILLEEAPPPEPAASVESAHTPEPARAEIVPFSARSDEALRALAAAHLARLRAAEPPALADLSAMVARRRAHLEHRVAVVATSAGDLADSLDAFLAGEARASVRAGRRTAAPGGLAFVFSGMGPQWWGMGRQLMAQEPVFRDTIERGDALLRPHADWSLLAELARDETTSRVGEADLAQVTSFAIQAGLVEVWKHWGVVPDAVLGHSAGEMGAVYAAGVLTLDECIVLAYHRSRLQARATGKGRMLAVGITAAAAAELIAPYGAAVAIAAINAPSSLTLSGDAEALEAIHGLLQERQAFSRFVPVVVPYHSAHMDPIREELLASLAALRPRASAVRIASEVTGDWIPGEAIDAAYWWRNVREPVRFADGVARLAEAGCTTFLELGAHPVLAAALSECLAAAGARPTVLASLRRQEDERAAMLRAAAALYAEGRVLDWATVAPRGARAVPLPTYPWQRERYWFESRAGDADQGRARSSAAGEHPLLGRRLRTARPTWETLLDGRAVTFLDDHLVQGALVYPGAAYTEMALATAAATRPDQPPAVREIEFQRALFMPDRPATVLQAVLDDASRRFEVHAATAAGEAGFTLHAHGTLSAADPAGRPSLDLDALRARCPREVGPDEYYEILARRGLGLGGAFRGIRRFWHGAGEAVARVEHDGLDVGPYQFHPALLDAAFQPLIGAATSEEDAKASSTGIFLPVHIRAVEVYARPGSRFWSYARVVSRTETGIEGDVFVFDDGGAVVVAIRGLRCRVLESARPLAAESLADWLYDYGWEEQPLAAAAGAAERSALDPAARLGVAGLAAEADRLSAEWGWRDYYGTVEARLSALATRHVARALAELGFTASPGSSVRTDALEKTLDIAARSRRLFGRGLEILAASGILEPAEGGWTVRHAVETGDPEPMVRALLAEFPDYAVDIRMLDRCGRSLAGVLRGTADAREVLFSPEAFPLLAELYRDSPPSRFYNTLAAESVAAAVRGASGARPLRLLELGAGTGGTTSYVLSRLRGAAGEYVFTDVSPFFAEQARQAFAGEPSLRTATLDIEADPGAQGFRDASFDVVLAANVLHATADLASSLAHVRRLLAPGGALVLQEITRQPLWLDVVFGLTDGWWRFRDLELRPKHPILEERAWRSLLERCGFVDVAAVADKDRAGEAAQTVLVAWRPEEEAHAARPDRRFLVFADAGGTAQRLEERLERGGASCVTVRPGPDADDDLARLLGELGPEPLAGILHLWSLDSPATEELDAASLLAAQERSCASTLGLLRALDRLDRRGERLWLVTTDTQAVESAAEPLAVAQAPLWGLARVSVKEQVGLRCRIVDLGEGAPDADLAALALEIEADDHEEELALRGRRRFVRRLRRAALPEAQAERTRPPRPGEGFRAVIETPGALDTLAFRPSPRRVPGPGEVEVKIVAASLNFREVMLAMGLLPPAASEGTFGAGQLGLDGAGTVEAVGPDVTDLAVGDEVIAAGVGTWASYVTTPAVLAVRKPARLTFEQGAQVPMAFVTALHALRNVARLQPGESVLIHSATGGVGLAALQVAREAGAVVYATAGSDEKRRHLETLGVSEPMSSRSLDFADEVLRRTDGRGVDVVLNSLSGEALVRGIDVLAPYGRFVEIGKRDVYEDSRIGLRALRRNASFSTVDIDRLSRERPAFVGGLIREAVEGLGSGRFQPLPQRVFPASRVEEALRHMAQGKHVGKIVLSLTDPDLALRVDAMTDLLSADATYLVTGGLGGFGLAVARRLAERGARHLVLVGRNPPRPETGEALAAIRAQGAEVVVESADVSRPDDVARVVARIRRELPPLRGIVHGAMVLDDAPLAQLDWTRLERVLAPKIAGAWNLHLHTAGDPLDFFVTFSSIAALLGNPLQANYAAANAFFEPFVHHRRAQGQPALNIAWGVLRGVGYLAGRGELAQYLQRQGYESFSIEQALEVLEALLPGPAVQSMAARIDWKAWSVASPAAAVSPRLRHLVPSDDEVAGRGGEAAAIGARLAELSPEARRAEVETMIRARAARVLGTGAAQVDPESPLTALGLDSLMAVEMMVALETDFSLQLPVVKLLQGMSVRGLTDLALERLGTPAPPKESATAAPPPAARGEEPPPRPPVAEPAPSPVLAAPPNGGNGATTPRPPNGIDYATLDYRRWNAPQRILRGTIAAAFRTVAEIQAEGLERIPDVGPFVLAINHLSLADAPLVLTLMPRPVITFAADYLRSSPIMNWFLSDLGHAIYLRRGEGDHEALEHGLEVLRAGGAVGLGPEGTRSRQGGLGPGRTGAAWLALRADVPVVPLAAWGQEQLGGHWRSLRRAPVRVRVGEPLRFPAGEPTARRLQEHTDEIMRALARLLPPDYRGVYA